MIIKVPSCTIDHHHAWTYFHSQQNSTPLLFAVLQDKADIVRMLLDAGAEQIESEIGTVGVDKLRTV